METKNASGSFQWLRETMEKCSEIVTEAYSKPIEELQIYTGELPTGHRSEDRRQRYWVTEYKGDLVVALPGTTHPLDWSSNLRVTYQPVNGSADGSSSSSSSELDGVPCAHAGFYYRAKTVPILHLLEQAADKGCRLLITGHSLGGAVANLCTIAALQAQKAALEPESNGQGPPQSWGTSRSGSSANSDRGYTWDSDSSRSATATAIHGNNIIEVSPAAALVEVLCVSFASPVYANAALARMIEANGWEESLVNVVVPEDYCLKLFNNVLTSAPQPGGKVLSWCCSSIGFKCSKQQLQTEYTADALELAGHSDSCEPLAQLDNKQAGEHSSCPDTSAVSRIGSEDIQPHAVPAEQPQQQQEQQPFATSLLGKKPKRKRVARLLKGMSSSKDCLTPIPALQPINCSNSSSSQPVSSSSDQPQRRPSWSQEVFGIPSSPSAGSLLSETSLTSTRSWTLLAYLPDVLTRTFSSSSSSSLGSSWSGSTSGSVSSGWSVSSVGSVRSRSSTGTHNSMDGSSTSSEHSSAACHVESTDSDSSSEPSSRSSTVNLAWIAGGNSRALQVPGQACPKAFCNGNSSGSGCEQLAPLAGNQGQQQQPGVQQLTHHANRNLYNLLAPASLALLTTGHKKLFRPVKSLLKGPDTLYALMKLLHLPSMRSVVLGSRIAYKAAAGAASKALNVPLDILEVGLVKALKPPLYQPVGQQWILSATGLVPQHQPIEQYPKHVHDVFWQKELMLVAFRAHSIVFCKQRLLKQANRR